MATSSAEHQRLHRGLNLIPAVALNMIDMIGVGPFITIPLIVAAMGGPQAMLGWVIGAAFALCDGLIWAELGAALPGEGGSYHYLREIYGRERWGRLFSFLYAWQVMFSAPLTIASGCIGLAMYTAFFWPGLGRADATGLAMSACLLALFLAYRQIRWIGRLAQWMWLGVLAAVAWVIVAGVTHFHPARAFDFPAHAFAPNANFLLGLGAAMLIAFYDYSGYENANFLADEVIAPERTLPRAILWSVALVAVIYVVMNISVLGVVPWREVMDARSPAHEYVVSVFMQRIGGNAAARGITLLIVWTAFASIFSLLLGYSRVVYAAALDGNFFPSFARVHPRLGFPTVALVATGLVATAFCVFRLDEVIAALVVIKILLQYLLQAVGVVVLRCRRPDLPRPFRIPLYPLPVVLATLGFLFLLFAPAGALRQLAYGLAVVAAGLALFLARARRTRDWPFTRIKG